MQLFLFTQIQELAKAKWRSPEPYTVSLVEFSAAQLAWFLEDLDRLKQLPPGKFQYLIADRLEKMGLGVQLVGDVFRKDGGVDIIAYPNGGLCTFPFLLAMQAKHHRSGRRRSPPPCMGARDTSGRGEPAGAGPAGPALGGASPAPEPRRGAETRRPSPGVPRVGPRTDTCAVPTPRPPDAPTDTPARGESSARPRAGRPGRSRGGLGALHPDQPRPVPRVPSARQRSAERSARGGPAPLPISVAGKTPAARRRHGPWHDDARAVREW